MEEFLWEKDYTEAELKAGYLLYRDGHIRSKIKRGAIYTVKIASYYYETVTVDTTGSKYRADCDCWDFRYYKKCEHCVAALYAVTLKPEELSYQDQQKIMPFSRAKQNKTEYHYFDMEKIAGQVAITNHTYELGKRLVEEKKLSQYQIQNFSYQTEAGGGVKNGLKLVLRKEASAKDKGDAVVLQVGKDFLWSAECNMRRCYCKTVVL